MPDGLKLKETGQGLSSVLLADAKRLQESLKAAGDLVAEVKAALKSQALTALKQVQHKLDVYRGVVVSQQGQVTDATDMGFTAGDYRSQVREAIRAAIRVEQKKKFEIAEKKRVAEAKAKAAEETKQAESEETSKVKADTLSVKTKKKKKKSSGLMNIWNSRAKAAEADMKSNVFSKHYDKSKQTKLKKGDKGYGSAKAGSKSAARAKKAKEWVKEQIGILIKTINKIGKKNKLSQQQVKSIPAAIAEAQSVTVGHKCCQVDFGLLFKTYQDISDTLVGMLRRAKKYKLLNFEGDMLFQGQSDNVIIFLLPKSEKWKWMPKK
jgi:hypothetical protein